MRRSRRDQIQRRIELNGAVIACGHIDAGRQRRPKPPVRYALEGETVNAAAREDVRTGGARADETLRACTS